MKATAQPFKPKVNRGIAGGELDMQMSIGYDLIADSRGLPVFFQFGVAFRNPTSLSGRNLAAWHLESDT